MMDTRAIQRLLVCLGILMLAAGARAVEVTNVQAAQYGSFVYVRYDLLGSESELTDATLSLQLSRDGGATFPNPASTLFGDYGADPSPGTGKYILWDVYADYPEAYVPEAALWVKLDTEDADNPDAATTPPKSAESPLFTLDTRLLSLDVDGDGAPDDRFDASQNGAFDVLDDFDADGVPDAFEDSNGDFIPDAYADANGNQVADGFEDANQDNIPDFFATRYAVYSPSHPRSDRTYFAAQFRAEWPNYYPAAAGYYWLVDQDPDTVVDDGDTYLPANALRAIEHTVSVTGTYYFHLAAVDADNVLIDGSQVAYKISVALEPPEITSSTHPNGASPARTFAAQVTAPPHGDLKWTFQSAPWESRAAHTSVVFNNRLWVIGGHKDGDFRNDVWSSPDGVTWTQVTAAAPWIQRNSHTSVVFDNKLWVIGGLTYNFDKAPGLPPDDDYYSKLFDVWSSPDGVTWTEVHSDVKQWSARASHTSLVFDNKLWVIGGSADGSGGNDVWSSPDAQQWTLATASAPWSKRSRHTSVVFGGKLWVIGGVVNDRPGNDVWSSPDGVTWTQVTETAPWGDIGGHTSVVFENKLWVIGGSVDGGRRNDVWSSPDGAAWTKVTAVAPWSKRSDHTSVVFNSKLWVICGRWGNDVWSYGRESTPASDISGYYYLLDGNPLTFPNIASPLSSTPDFTFPCNALSDHWFHGVAVDTLGNYSPATLYRFEVLETAPALSSPTHPHVQLTYSGAGVRFVWDDGGVPEVVGYHYAFDDQPESQPSIPTTETSISFDCVPPGVYWFHVQSEDECGYRSPVTRRRISVGGVTQGPAVHSFSHPSSYLAYTGRDVALYWTESENMGGPYHYVWNRDPYTIPDDGSPSTNETSLPPIENQPIGMHFLHVYGVDRCGVRTALTTYPVRIREAMPPVISLAPVSSKSAMTFTWTDPDDFANGTPKFYYAFDDIASTEPGPGAAATDEMQHEAFNVPDGLHYLHVRAQDRHGNLSPVAHYAVNAGDTLVGLSAPSSTVTRTESVDYWVTYPGATDVSLIGPDLTLNKTGTASGAVNVWATENPQVKRIRIFNITGDGTLGITIAAGSAQFPDGMSAPRIGPSETFEVDNTPPGITISGPAPTITSTGPVTWTVTYTGAQDILLLPQSVRLYKSLNANGTVSLGGTGNTRTITVSSITGDDDLWPGVAWGTATDAAGNWADGRWGDWVKVDNTYPLIELSGPSAAFSNGETIAYTVTYERADTITLRPEDISLVTTGDATGDVAVTGDGNSSRTVSILRPSGYGTIGITIAPGTARDAAGDLALASGPSEVFSVAHYRLHMMVYGRGTTTPAEGVHTYAAAAEVTLIATPEDGAEFLGWEIDGIANQALPSTITMNQNHAVRANFTRGLHSADQDGDSTISFSELLRVIQLYNSAGYGCEPDTEDGYAPDAPGQDCTPHANDYNPQDWKVKLTEMLRTIQFYNRGGYTPCPEGEDGFCPAT
jgi:hypothetical protein